MKSYAPNQAVLEAGQYCDDCVVEGCWLRGRVWECDQKEAKQK